MRLFVAVAIPVQVREAVTRAVEDLHALSPAGLRWADPERWHLTLAFFGEVQDARLDELTRRLARAAGRHRAPVLRIEQAGRFGGRVLWARIVEAQESDHVLSGLADSVAAAARRTGIAQEERSYRPHLTLARSQSNVDLRPLVDALAGLRSDSWTAHEVLLVRSRLGPHPEHTTLRAFALSAQ